MAVATSIDDDVVLALVDSDDDVDVVGAVHPGIVTEGFLAEAAGVAGNHAAAEDFPGVEIWNPVVVYTVAIVIGVVAGGGEVSTGIHMATAGFLADDAGVGGDHPVAGVFTGVETLHTQSGKPHVHAKLKWGGIWQFSSFLLFFSISENQIAKSESRGASTVLM